MQDYYIDLLTQRDHDRLTNIRAGLREGTPLSQQLTVQLVGFQHFVVSVIVLGAVYLVFTGIFTVEIIIQKIKKKSQKENEEKKGDNENKDTKIAWEKGECKARKGERVAMESTEKTSTETVRDAEKTK